MPARPTVGVPTYEFRHSVKTVSSKVLNPEPRPLNPTRCPRSTVQALDDPA